jgi:hypothetical protein
MPTNGKSNQYVIRHVWRYQRVIKSVNLKDRQYNDKYKKGKRTNNCGHNTIQKTKN